jgi:hypothetical protein
MSIHMFLNTRLPNFQDSHFLPWTARFETASLHTKNKTALRNMKHRLQRIIVPLFLLIAPSVYEICVGFSSHAWRAIYLPRRCRRL